MIDTQQQYINLNYVYGLMRVSNKVDLQYLCIWFNENK